MPSDGVCNLDLEAEFVRNFLKDSPKVNFETVTFSIYKARKLSASLKDSKIELKNFSYSIFLEQNEIFSKVQNVGGPSVTVVTSFTCDTEGYLKQLME